jgi:hypothetical protein
MLTLFGIRRQSKLDKEDYKVYASDLERHELNDIDKALQNLVRHPRVPGESAFPEVAVIVEAVKAVKRARIKPEFDVAAYMADFRAHPQNYISVDECIDEEIAKRRAQGKRVWERR